MSPENTSVCHILLVEENPVDVDLTKRAFTRDNRPTIFDLARDGEEALGFITQWEKGVPTPTFILLDLKLPKIDGLQVIREIKLHPKYRVIPIVVLTSSSEDRDIQVAYNLGANSYIVKEIDFERFTNIAAEVKLYWCHLNILPASAVR